MKFDPKMLISLWDSKAVPLIGILKVFEGHETELEGYIRGVVVAQKQKVKDLEWKIRELESRKEASVVKIMASDLNEQKQSQQPIKKPPITRPRTKLVLDALYTGPLSFDDLVMAAYDDGNWAAREGITRMLGLGYIKFEKEKGVYSITEFGLEHREILKDNPFNRPKGYFTKKREEERRGK